MSKIITLVAAGYVNAIAGDIGKPVTDDAVTIGNLLGYNNTTREWWIETTAIVASDSTMAITGGTGAGTSITAYYCLLGSVKERLLIPTSDTSYDTEIALAILEAEDYINEHLRPYLTYRQTVTLSETGYVNCDLEDIGMTILDDEVAIGTLLSYNNTTRIWKVKTTSTIAIDSELKIDGTLRGTASGASTDDVTEAESPIFVFKTLPLVATIPDQIEVICADLAAGIVQRRKMPEDFSTGWWNQGIRKLETFIKNNWHQGKICI